MTKLALSLALVIGLVLAATRASPADAAPGAQMQVRAGFDGIGKIGGWLPVDIDVRNDGDDIVGEVQILVQDSAPNRGPYTGAPTLYSLPVVLPKRAHKRLQMEVRLVSTSQKMRAMLVDGSSVLLDQEVQMSRVGTGDMLCGVVSRTATAFDFLPALELPAPLRRVRLARVEAQDIPTRPQLLGALDCLIVDNMPTASLNDAQRDAMRSWVANGGMLIVAGGAGWQRTFQGLPADLLPIRVTGLQPLDRLDNLAEFAREGFADRGQWLASQAVVTDGNAVIEQDGTPLLVGARRGLGSVFYLGLDPATEPLRGWAGSANVWRYMLSHGVTSTAFGQGGINSYGGWGRPPRNALTDISPLNPPSPNALVVVLVVFLAAVGPGNYLLLRRVGQPSWTLVTVPLLTVIFGLLAFGVASAGRDNDLVISKVSIARYMPPAPMAHARTYVGLLSRQAATYDVQADGGVLVYGQWYPFPRDAATEGPSWALKVLSGPQPEVSELTLPAGSLATFSIDSQLRAPGGLQADLQTDGQEVSGTLTNRTGHAISDAFMIIEYVPHRVGDLKEGETREVSFTLPAGAAGYGPPNSFASQLYPSGLPTKRPTDAARRDVLDQVFGQAFNSTRLELHGLTFLGWLEGGSPELALREGRPATLENTLLVGTLPVRIPKGYEGDVPAALIPHRPIGLTTASRQTFGQYNLSIGESLAIQYSLPVHTGRFLLERLDLHIEGRLRGAGQATAPLGDVSLFNWRTAEWDEYSVKFGLQTITSPLRYISGTGDVRLRYTFRPAGGASVTAVDISRLDVRPVGVMR